MGYERNDRRPGGDYGRQSYAGGRDPRGGYDRDERFGRGRDYGRAPQGYDYEDRGFLDRAGDEVRSWFGDDEAERRRRMDERYEERDGGRAWSGGSYGRGNAERWREHDYDRAGLGMGGDYGARSWNGGEGYRGEGGRGGGQPRDAAPRRQDHHDESYRSWRDRQMAAYDRDYDEYRREHQSRFEQDFGAWRQTRETQRASLSRVKEHQEVVGSDGQHVGVVDKVRDDRIVLTKNDQSSGGHHHSIPCSWIESVDEKVTIKKTAAEAQRHWQDEEKSAMFGRGDDDQRGSEGNGPHALNRSFSGTY